MSSRLTFPPRPPRLGVVSSVLRLERMDARLTCSQLAQRLGWFQSGIMAEEEWAECIDAYERGLAVPTLATARFVLDALGAKFDPEGGPCPWCAVHEAYPPGHNGAAT